MTDKLFVFFVFIVLSASFFFPLPHNLSAKEIDLTQFEPSEKMEENVEKYDFSGLVEATSSSKKTEIIQLAILAIGIIIIFFLLFYFRKTIFHKLKKMIFAIAETIPLTLGIFLISIAFKYYQYSRFLRDEEYIFKFFFCLIFGIALFCYGFKKVFCKQK